MSRVSWLVLAIGIGLVVLVGLILRQREIAGPVRTPAERQVQELRQQLEQATLQAHKREMDLRSAEAFFGWDSLLVSQLKICNSAGYPPTTSHLSRREIAECDAVLNRLYKREAQFAAEEAKRDAAYDKAHPVKK